MTGPTLMVLAGQPSTPEAMFDGFSFARQETRAIDSGTVKLLIVVSKQDKDSWTPGAKYADASQMVSESAGIPGVATLLLDSGGHNYSTYGPTLPKALSWLSQVGAI